MADRRAETPKKRHKPAEIVAKLRQVDVLVSPWQSVADAIRSIGVTEVNYCRWRREFGSLKSDQVKRVKELEAENARLRDELLGGEIFYSLPEAKIIVESGRQHFNTVRPHGSLEYKPPAPEVFIPAMTARAAAQTRPATPPALSSRPTVH
nr:integrase core domain-containing protein [Bosea sp. REN20]